MGWEFGPGRGDVVGRGFRRGVGWGFGPGAGWGGDSGPARGVVGILFGVRWGIFYLFADFSLFG
mgnify:CR=1 FL=1